MITPSDTFLDEMESGMQEDMVFATCEMVANRHISLILQEDVHGRVNFWQRSDGQSPLYTHVKMSGFRVTATSIDAADHVRNARETVLVPVETPLLSSSQSLYSLDHGFHVHTFGNLTRGCQYTGPHYNPSNSTHGSPLDERRHVGDLGNIRCDANGEIDSEMAYPRVSLIGDHSIIGRSLVVS